MRNKIAFLLTVVIVFLLPGVAYSQQDQPKPKPDSQKVPDDYQPPKVIHAADPIYPSEAAAKRITGTVILEGLVDKEGNVVKTKVLSGPPIFYDPAVEALKKYKYKPATLRGQPTEGKIQVHFSFNGMSRR